MEDLPPSYPAVRVTKSRPLSEGQQLQNELRHFRMNGYRDQSTDVTDRALGPGFRLAPHNQ